MFSKIEQFNQLVRSIVTLLMTGAFVYGFLIKLVGTEAFVTMFGTVVTWWFVSRTTQQQRAGDLGPPHAAPPAEPGKPGEKGP